MKEIFYKFPHIILPVIGIVLWGIGFFLSEIVDLNDGLLWLPFVLAQLFISFFCGKLIQELYQGAYRDCLTGLNERRYFYQKLADELERLKRTKSTFSLIMIDVDDFKSINDKYGHLKGDEVLKQLAEILEKNIRAIDTVVRWGGEEFFFILPGTDNNVAVAFAERIRKTVETYDFNCKVTISAGVVSVNKVMGIKHLIKLADKALYEAKKEKNTVFVVKNPF